MAFYGDGAASQGDASEGLVFAASYEAPVVFFVQNNKWAISVPSTRQSRFPLHERARGFGLDAAWVDGNDPLASFAVTRAGCRRVGTVRGSPPAAPPTAPGSSLSRCYRRVNMRRL